MSVILILILASLAMALLFLGCFIWAARSGQYEDTFTPSMRVLMDEDERFGQSSTGVSNRTVLSRSTIPPQKLTGETPVPLNLSTKSKSKSS